MEFTSTEEKKERVILIAVDTDEVGATVASVSASLDELAELCETADAEVIDRMIQSREHADRTTYFGKGKTQELKELVLALDADAVVADDELTPAQMKNLEEALGVKICDRTMVILDIFAKHAQTREGKIQVELAQLKYRSQRLLGMGTQMSRLGGGIGTRGPGEKKLEIDRRLIRDRISRLNSELKEIVKNRELLRKQRERQEMPVIAIVGYTNAGKSTLLNKLSGADILAADMLFATLDATTRNKKLASGQEVLFTDTVGFINKLPHHLVDAFKSTLEEASYADIILHVVDSSNENAFMQMAVVYETLKSLKIEGKPVVTVFNKQDNLSDEFSLNTPLKDLKADYTVKASARTGEGLDELEAVIEKILKDSKVYIERKIPYSDGGYLAKVRKSGQILKEEYLEDGIYIEAYVPRRLL